MNAPYTLPNFGARLRRLRRIRGLKQAYIAELCEVTQTTISRWEASQIAPATDISDRILALISGPSRDEGLERLVRSSTLAVHLVTDLDHKLLAASPAREAQWGCKAEKYVGQSLWRFATPEIVANEVALTDHGWWNCSHPTPVQLRTGHGGSQDLTIVEDDLLWERVWLSDGTPARLCSSI